MDFRILGPMEVWLDGRSVDLPGPRQRALLAVLLLHANEVVSSDRLLEDLWGEKIPAAGHTALRVRVSQLRKALGPASELLVTQPPGYVLRVQPGQLDLRRFERMVGEGERALAAGDAEQAAELLSGALALWRGQPFADLAYEPFIQAPVTRLEELRLAALELRIDADLALGRQNRLVGELQELVAQHPLRERLWGQLMIALYRDGRQAEALAAFAAARARLVEEIGIEPGPPLQELQRRVLEQDPGLALGRQAPPPRASRAILVLPGHLDATDALMDLGADLARAAEHELVGVALLPAAAQLAEANRRLDAARDRALRLTSHVRVAAFTSPDAGSDAVRLVSEQDVSMLLVDASPGVLETGRADAALTAVMTGAVCDVALVVPGAAGEGPVVVPFAGHAHDWCALELGAWLATAHGVALRLIGVEAGRGTRDASRLLASASLSLQRGIGIRTESALVPAGAQGVVGAARDATAVVVALSERWEREGLGKARLEIARAAQPPVLFVRRGLRPGALAPPEALTRFTWSRAGG